MRRAPPTFAAFATIRIKTPRPGCAAATRAALRAAIAVLIINPCASQRAERRKLSVSRWTFGSGEWRDFQDTPDPPAVRLVQLVCLLYQTSPSASALLLGLETSRALVDTELLDLKRNRRNQKTPTCSFCD